MKRTRERMRGVVRAGCTAGPVSVLEQRQDGRVAGTVLDGAGGALASMTVRLSRRMKVDGVEGIRVCDEGVTDSEGRFSFTVTGDAQFGLMVLPGPDQPFSDVDEFPVGRGGATVVVHMLPGATLRCEVERGRDPMEYEVTMMPTSSRSNCGQVAASHRVRFRDAFELTGLVPTTYALSARWRSGEARPWMRKERWFTADVSPKRIAVPVGYSIVPIRIAKRGRSVEH